jgi:peptidoglycan-associated lipoprotein
MISVRPEKRLKLALITVTVCLGILLTLSCARKSIRVDTPTTSGDAATTDLAAEAARKAQEAELERQRREEEQRRLEEERLLEAQQQRALEAGEQASVQEQREAFQMEDIYFDFDSYSIVPAAQEVLIRKADWLRGNPDVLVQIEGHTDSRGTGEYNLALGERRAESAKNFLIDLGIEASRMTTVSYGEERPVDPDQNEDAWAKNRRAHFVIH